MIIKKRFSFFFGLISSLSLAAGFARAADRLDPVSNASPAGHPTSAMKPAPDTTTLCWAS
jgi:hypothetical protein